MNKETLRNINKNLLCELISINNESNDWEKYDIKFPISQLAFIKFMISFLVKIEKKLIKGNENNKKNKNINDVDFYTNDNNNRNKVNNI